MPKNKKTQKLKKKSASTAVIGEYCRARCREVFFLMMLAVVAIICISLVTHHASDPSWSSYAGGQHAVHNAAGRVGAYLSDLMLFFFGVAAYLFPCVMFWRTYCAIRRRGQLNVEHYRPMRLVQYIGFLVLMVCMTGLISIHISLNTDWSYQAGGVLGDSIAGMMSHWFNPLGATLILFLLAFYALSLLLGSSVFHLLECIGEAVSFVFSITRQLLSHISNAPYAIVYERVKEFVASKYAQLNQCPTKKEESPAVVVSQPSRSEANPVAQPVVQARTFTRADQCSTQEPTAKVKVGKIARRPKHGSLPVLSLLDQANDTHKVAISEAALEQTAREVEARLADFGVSVRVAGVYPGPVVTRYECDLAPGTKASKVSNLAKDLARSLSVMSVRVVEVIPGKSYIGIELPNTKREMVFLRQILSSSNYTKSGHALPLALGKDIAGESVVVDLAKMPHLLVAGTTGSGKSVGLNAMLMSLLYHATPADLRLIMIDPKMLELSVYEGVPHLLTPVVTDMKDAAKALRWCVSEMERRYHLMAAAGVRNLSGYNEKIRQAEAAGEPLLDSTKSMNEGMAAQPLETLPHIVVLADEFADMMVVVGKKVETLIARLAQKARAAGIHLILATQRPSVDVITGLIKANIPTRIAFQVSSKVDSRTILDQQGAEQLLGYGDMLYLAPGTGVPSRVHGCYVSDDEVHRVVRYLVDAYDTEYDNNILSDAASSGGESAWLAGMDPVDGERDAHYDEAVAFVAKSRRVSISSIQRRFKIGYNRAATIVESMEAAGVVSAMESNGSREVLVPEPTDS